MASTYLAGVFLTIYTYDGPQLVYHYYDPRHVEATVQQDASDQPQYDWSDDDFSEDDSALSTSPASSRVSLVTLPSQAIAIGEDTANISNITVNTSSLGRSSRNEVSVPNTSSGSLPPSSIKSSGSSLLSQGLKTAALNVPQSTLNRSSDIVVASSLSTANALANSSLSGDLLTVKPASAMKSVEEEPDQKTESTGIIPDSIAQTQESEVTSTVSSDTVTSPARDQSEPSLQPQQQPQQHHHHQQRQSSQQLQSQSQQQVASENHSDSVSAPLMPAGLDADMIAEILTPPESMCNEKFSLTVESCTFVGIPVHILESGTWRPLKKSYQEEMRKIESAQSGSNRGKPLATDAGKDIKDDNNDGENDHSETADGENAVDENADGENAVGENAVGGDTEVASPGNENVELPSDENSGSPVENAAQSEIPPDSNDPAAISGIITEKDSPMRMFHISFAILPPITEASDCEDRLYKAILIPFIRLLRQEQASKNYVWDQVSKILKAQDATAHLNIADQQAAVESASELAASLRKMYTAISKMDIARIMIANKPRAFQIPLQLELAQLPKWYENVSPYAYVSTSNSPEKEITHDIYTCYGLLLLDDPEIIVEEIDVDPQGPVAAMIRNIDPTSSLDELSRQNNIEISQIVSLVWSLVYWRRARIIIPLHSRFTYTVSPMAPRGARFHALSKAFNSIFPMMPPIQRLLGLLSTGKPKPFAMHIPTNDHRYIYMQALAWLLQNDFIVHLPTFALIVITKKIKLSAHNYEELVQNNAVVDDADEGDNSTEPKQTKPEGPPKPSSRTHTYRIDPDDIRDSVILDPRTASTIEKRWLSQVMMSGATRNPDQAALFQRLSKYFNGKDCLEQVMIHEKITREDMRTFLQEYSQYIVTYKHW